MSKNCALCKRKLGPLNFKYSSLEKATICRQCIIQAGYGSNASFIEIKKIPLETIEHNVSLLGERTLESLEQLSDNAIKCPNCNSTEAEFMNNDRKSFSVGKAAAGAALTGGIGTLAGFAGKKGNNQWHCKNCGQTFETK